MEAKKIPPQKDGVDDLKVTDVAKEKAKALWDRAARIAVPIGSVGGFCADVLTPLGPVVAYLTLAATVSCLISGAIWYGIKRHQINRALADGHIDENEHREIMANGIWPTVFAFSLVSSMVLTVFFFAQRTFATDSPPKGLIATEFPLVEGLQKQLFAIRASTDRIESATKRLENGNAEIQQAIDGLNAKLDGLGGKLDVLNKDSQVIERPKSPEDHYLNARLFELRGQPAKARESYLEYMKSDLPYLDPHLSLTALLKIQDGRQAAHEEYGLYIKPRNPSSLLARALLLERAARLTALAQLSQDFPEYGPTFYYLSKEYSAPEAGQQTLENLKVEKLALEKFRKLADRGLFTEYFIDKRLAVSLEIEANQRSRKFAEMNDSYLNAHAKITLLPSEDGWEGMIVIPYDGAEVLVKLPGEKIFKSTGFTKDINPATGKPLPVTSVAFKGLSAGIISIKYIDRQGVEQGPFETQFDLVKEFVQFAKQIMPKNPGDLAPLHRWKDKKMITLVQLMMVRSALRQVKVGPDPEHIDHALTLPPADGTYAVRNVQADDPLITQDIPLAWKKVYLQLEFADGSRGEPLSLE